MFPNSRDDGGRGGTRGSFVEPTLVLFSLDNKSTYDLPHKGNLLSHSKRDQRPRYVEIFNRSGGAKVASPMLSIFLFFIFSSNRQSAN